MSASDRLSRVQARALTALMCERTITAAATKAGCSERTLRRWLSSEPFALAFRAAARESVREATTALLACQLEAVSVLRAALVGGTPADRVRAARALLELGAKVTEIDLDERLRQLEEEVRSWDGTPKLGLVR